MIVAALVYEALYAGVFGMNASAIQKSLDDMLRQKTYLNLKRQRKNLAYVTEDGSLPPGLEKLPPIPYRVAKALDSQFYRNVEMDLWLQDQRNSPPLSPHQTETRAVTVGSRCRISLPDDPFKKLLCYVVSKSHGSQVQVYVPSFGRK